MLLDNYQRVHDYLRLSITDKCNFRCTYCNPVDLPRGYFAGQPRMFADEIDKIVSVFVSLGVKKIRLTGGEPLVRKDAREIVERLAQYPVELAITTNGTFLHEYIDLFNRCGLKSVNVSLDSLDSTTFKKITGRDQHVRVMENIGLLLENDFHVKVNMVVIKDVNQTEILDFVEWTRNLPVHVRFIEFMPFAGNAWSSNKVFPYKEMLDLIRTRYEYEKLADDVNHTAKKYCVPGFKGTFAVISSMTQPFCSGCNRLRLTSDGKMKNCLFANQEADILGALRSGEDIVPIIRQCVGMKAERLGGQFEQTDQGIAVITQQNRSMINIGG